MEPPSRIRQIPLEGGSGNFPTGAIQFQNDWPGLFLRGDTAIPLLVSIRALAEKLKDDDDPIIFFCMDRLGRIADMIDRDIVVRQAVETHEPPTLDKKG